MLRTDTVESAYFEDPLRYAEWTWLAFKLARDGKAVAVVDQFLFRIHETPSSASKTTGYGEALATLKND